MLTIQISKSFNEWWTYREANLLKTASSDNHHFFITKNVVAQSPFVCSSSSCIKEFRSHLLWKTPKQSTMKRRLHLPICASLDEDYRSSRNIAISLFRRYRNVVDRGGTDNLKEFISAGVNAYALGCTDDGLRKELVNLKESGLEIEGLHAYGGSTSLKYKIFSEEVLCLLPLVLPGFCASLLLPALDCRRTQEVVPLPACPCARLRKTDLHLRKGLPTLPCWTAASAAATAASCCCSGFAQASSGVSRGLQMSRSMNAFFG